MNGCSYNLRKVPQKVIASQCDCYLAGFFFVSNDLHILQTTCITNKNITENTI